MELSHSGSRYHPGAEGGPEIMSETQWHHDSPVQLPNPMSTTSQNHSATTEMLPRNILTGKIKHLSNNFLLMTNFPKRWLVCLLRGHSIFLLPIPKLLSLTNSPQSRPSRCFQKEHRLLFESLRHFPSCSLIAEWSNFTQMLGGPEHSAQDSTRGLTPFNWSAQFTCLISNVLSLRDCPFTTGTSR